MAWMSTREGIRAFAHPPRCESQCAACAYPIRGVGEVASAAQPLLRGTRAGNMPIRQRMSAYSSYQPSAVSLKCLVDAWGLAPRGRVHWVQMEAAVPRRLPAILHLELP